MAPALDPQSDPDRFALAVVQQYLHEQGFCTALAALEHESGLHVKNEPARGSALLALVYDHCEALAAAGLDEAAAARRALEEELLAGGSAAGPGPCPCRLRAALEGLHPANITAVTCWPQRALAVTGCADGSVLVLGYDGTLSGTLSAGTSGVLCLALSPDSLGGSGGGSIGSGNLIAAGCMDGSVAVLDSESCAMLACAQPHRKYVVAAAWASDGRHLVTGSWDQSFAVHCLQRRTGSAAAEAAEAEAEAAPAVAAAGEEGSWELVEVYREQCTGKVNAAVFLPPLSNHGSEGNGERSGDTGSGGGPSFLVAVQGSNYLRELCIAPGSSAAAGDDSTAAATDIEPAAAAAAAAATVREVCRRNMNVTGDDHVSFSAAHLALAPCGRLLLVSADNGRLVLYERVGWTPLRTLIGLPVEQFHQYAAAIDASGHYAIAAAAGGALCIFHLGTARLVATLAAHPAKNVRGLCFDGLNNLLLTCSFDRSVKIWEAADGRGHQA
ncbi:WD40 repeat-containing [Micractinium conductrix]|uniref:WD40 repeat-containing n=1 Tax=Micractinium conductrix TaxID=554055 RepID=A0A2P6VF71_9CHLO|nr:WD40 repeat-containing [Micractinium conductrix]|eukprot:PSC72719.1 WD40 repeat-containing [Micractinium conductrix]